MGFRKAAILAYNFLGAEPFEWEGDDQHFQAEFESGGERYTIHGGWIPLLHSAQSVDSFLGTRNFSSFVRDLREAGLYQKAQRMYAPYFAVTDSRGNTIYGADGEAKDERLVPATRRLFATAYDFFKSTYQSYPGVGVVASSSSGRASLYQRMIFNLVGDSFRKFSYDRMTVFVPTKEIEILSSLVVAKESDPSLSENQLSRRALKEYGTTYSPGEAIYIMANGDLLDGSGARFGRSLGGRAIDHHEVIGLLRGGSSYRSRYAAMFSFCAKTGAIRCDFNTGAFSIVLSPNRYQIRAMADGLDELGKDVAYLNMVRPSGEVSYTFDLDAPTFSRLKSFFNDPLGWVRAGGDPAEFPDDEEY